MKRFSFVLALAFLLPPASLGQTERAVAKPMWVTSSGRAFPERAQNTFFGVGVAEMLEFERKSERRRASVESAQDDMAAQIHTFVADAFAVEMRKRPLEERSTEEAATLCRGIEDAVIDAVRSAIALEEIWADPQTGDFYALVSLDADRIAEALKKEMTGLHEREPGEEDKTEADAATEAPEQPPKDEPRSLGESGAQAGPADGVKPTRQSGASSSAWLFLLLACGIGSVAAVYIIFLRKRSGVKQ